MKRVIFILGLTFAVMISAQAQQQKLYSVFMYTFTKHITWPNNSGNFVIEILGDDQLYAEMVKISKVKKVGARTMEVKKISSVSQSKNPHMLFIGKSKLSQVDAAKSRISKSTLLITNDDDYAASFHHINFVPSGSRVNFEIYEKELNNTNLKISGQLKSLGKVK